MHANKPVPGVPAMRTALPAIFPSLIISRTTPAARRARACPTNPENMHLGLKFNPQILLLTPKNQFINGQIKMVN